MGAAFACAATHAQLSLEAATDLGKRGSSWGSLFGTGNAGRGSATGVGEWERAIAILVNLTAHVTHCFTGPKSTRLGIKQRSCDLIFNVLRTEAIARSNGAKRSSRQNGQAEAIKLICISQNFNDRRARAAHSD